MKTLNLIDLEKSDIKYKISKFPDGQQQVIITGDDSIKSWFIYYQLHKYPIQIKSRLNNWLDLELITCAVASLRELGVEEIHLYVPYIIGARSDRKFEEGGNNYVKHVIAPAINLLNFKSVTCIDPHSDVLEACINNFKKMDNFMLTAWVMNLQLKDYNFKNSILVSPDAGASKKIYKIAEQINYKGDIITCSKDRDVNGKLTKTVVPYNDDTITEGKDYIIIDDICDGGATFINIAKALLENFESEEWDGYKPKIYLIVTHGIFSKRFEELSKYFDGIYCTNSYSDTEFGPPLADGFCINQLNVF